MASNDSMRPASAGNVKEAVADAISKSTAREVLLTVGKGVTSQDKVIFFGSKDEFPNLEITISNNTQSQMQTYTVPFETQTLTFGTGMTVWVTAGNGYGSIKTGISTGWYCKVVGIRSGGGVTS